MSPIKNTDEVASKQLKLSSLSENGVVGNSDDVENIWEDILLEVQDSSKRKLPAGKSLLVLGDNDSGKTTLIAKLAGLEEPKKGSGLEYHCVTVDDDYSDDNVALGVYALDGDPVHAHLLQYTLTNTNIADVVVVIVASLSHPWDIPSSVKRWLDVLDDHISLLNIPGDAMRKQRDLILSNFQEYIEPSVESPKRQAPPTTPSSDEERVVRVLDDGTLTRNLGLPIVLVLTKSDHMPVLEKELDYREEHFDFIQAEVRRMCLSCGAALLTVSVKENKNCDLLYKYLTHLVYGLPFSVPALVVERDALFVPAGWDSEKKISILGENMSLLTPDAAYTDVISPPAPTRRSGAHRELDVAAEEAQGFLSRVQVALQAQPATTTPRTSDAAAALVRTPGGSAGGGKSPRVTSSPVIPGSPKKGTTVDKMANAPNSEGVLANFFNSLLQNKKAGGSPGGSPLSRGESGEVDPNETPRSTRNVRGATSGSTNT